LLTRVEPQIRKLPEDLRVVVVGAFCGAAHPQSVSEVADLAGIRRRTVDRWMVRAGIRSASALVKVAGAARAWDTTTRGAVHLRPRQPVSRSDAHAFETIRGRTVRDAVIRSSLDDFVNLATEYLSRKEVESGGERVPSILLR
jgi:hypothetical protein